MIYFLIIIYFFYNNQTTTIVNLIRFKSGLLNQLNFMTNQTYKYYLYPFYNWDVGQVLLLNINNNNITGIYFKTNLKL